MTIIMLVLYLISISVNSSNVSIQFQSDESYVILHNTFWVAVDVSSAFVTQWVHIMFCLRSATRQECLQWLQVMNFYPTAHKLTFFAWCTRVVSVNVPDLLYLTYKYDRLITWWHLFNWSIHILNNATCRNRCCYDIFLTTDFLDLEMTYFVCASF